MMYLVLTAMLALNVSSEVLNGFSTVDEAIRTSITSAEARKEALYDDFQSQYEQNPAKVKEWLDKASMLRQKSDSLYDYIQNFKYEMVRLADKDNTDPDVIDIKSKDNTDVTGQYGLAQKNGEELKERLEAYREFLVELSDGDSIRAEGYRMRFHLETPKGKQSWEQGLFESMPLSAVVTLLTKYQNDVRSTEMDMVQYLKSQTDASDFRVNKIEALVVPNSNYVMKGSRYKAQIVLSAVDSTARPAYFVGGERLSESGVYECTATATGPVKYSGYVRLPGNDGVVRSYPFSSEYTVGEPTATISNVDLNVVYLGIDNKFSVSVPGVTAEDIEVSAKGAKVRKAGSYYIINPTQDSDIDIMVSANLDGKMIQMGSMRYRVKYIPDPKSFVQYRDNGGVIRQLQEGRLSKNVLRSDNFSIIAGYGPDELIKAEFEVVSFSITTKIGTVDATGNKLTKRQLDDINRLERGDVVTFRNIKAKGPDGKIRTLGLLQIDI